jgi:transcriptional regulator with XRE-family HTH domain
MLAPDETRRADLARLLTTARKALPTPPAGRRRNPGWRREEVADAAGISVTWYTWLEQGRDISASEHALKRLAATLRLDQTETRYLFDLARPDRGPEPETGAVAELQPFLDGLLPHAAYALDRGWNIIASNAEARRLLGIANENLVEKLFLDPAWRRLFIDWDTLAASVVGQFRAAIGARPAYAPLVQRIAAQSETFARLWAEGGIASPPIWTKQLAHPELGRLTFRYAALALPGAADITVSIYSRVG